MDEECPCRDEQPVSCPTCGADAATGVCRVGNPLRETVQTLEAHGVQVEEFDVPF